MFRLFRYTIVTLAYSVGLFILVSCSPEDPLAPDLYGIRDLTIVDVGPTSIELRWTVPTDAENGDPVVAYEFRYANSSSVLNNWANATPVSNPPHPGNPGETQSLIVTNLSPGRTYYFGAKIRTRSSQTSILSEIVSATTIGTSVAVYVNASFAGMPDGSREAPFVSIETALQVAEQIEAGIVYVAIGSYEGTVQVVNGISLLGGYDGNTWEKTDTTSTVIGGDGFPLMNLALLARGIQERTFIEGFELKPGTLPSTVDRTLTSHRYTVYIADSPGFVLANCVVIGEEADSEKGLNGSNGSDGDEFGCDGGNGGPGWGTGSCLSDYSGGFGFGEKGDDGEGGESCGVPGTGAGGKGGGGGTPEDPAGENGGDGQDGNNGDIGRDGVPGHWITVGNPWSTLHPEYSGLKIWKAEWSASGQPGGNGGGGGGGGGSAAYCLDGWIDCYGHQGSNGGAGGGGGNGGQGGMGGGATFGIVILRSACHLRDVVVTGGHGGQGGDGGPGGKGHPGHLGSGIRYCCQPYGLSMFICAGHGPKGGSGGDGGAGQGGSGGPSWCVFVHGSEAPTIDRVIYMTGEGGTGGSPGGPQGPKGGLYCEPCQGAEK